jgi:multicomponent K+:H+ antiporter subunit E
MSRLEKIVPEPLMSVVLLVLWLLLVQSLSPGQVILGLVLALVVPPLTAPLRPARLHARRADVALRYLMTVGYDVLKSNLEVGLGVVRSPWRMPRSRFVVIPLELQDSLGLAVLATVVTVVPGTVWSELALDRSALLLHVWDVEDEQEFVARFKTRYERPLRDIFE